MNDGTWGTRKSEWLMKIIFGQLIIIIIEYWLRYGNFPFGGYIYLTNIQFKSHFHLQWNCASVRLIQIIGYAFNRIWHVLMRWATAAHRKKNNNPNEQILFVPFKFCTIKKKKKSSSKNINETKRKFICMKYAEGHE